MPKAIGPSFPAELEAAGITGLPFSWGADGTFEWGAAITNEQRVAVEAVYAAHDPVKSNLLQYARSKRKKVAEGNTADGYWTDPETRSTIAQAIQMIDIGILPEPINWKTPGGFIEADRDDLVNMATVVGLHVQNAFDAEAVAIEGINAGTITTTGQIDALDWPANG